MTGTVVVATSGTRVLRVAGYVRYSSHLQDDGYSIEAQRHAILRDGEGWGREHAGESWGAVTWFEEPARSAKHEKLALRTTLSALLRDVEAGRYDLIVVHKFNRLARHLKDQLTFTAQITGAGCGLYSVVEHSDLSTPTSRLTANIMGSVAQFFVEDLGEEVRKGLGARARRDGLPVHRPPFGYRWPASGDSSQAPVYDEGGNWDGYLLLKAMLLAGYDQQQVADALNAENADRPAAARWTTGAPARNRLGLPPSGRFTREFVRAVRSNVFYRPFEPGDTHGTVRHGETLYRGAHLAACTWEEWHRMQQLAWERKRCHSSASSRRTPDALEDVLEFRGIVACAACMARGALGDVYTRHAWSGNVRGTAIRHDYYRCHAQLRGEVCPDEGHYARAADVRAAWLAWVRTHLHLPDAWQELLVAQARAWARSGGVTEETEQQSSGAVTRLTAERGIWMKRRRRAIETYLDGDIDRAERDRRVSEADAQLERIRRDETEAETGQSHSGGDADGAESARVARLFEAGRFVAELADDWLDMTSEERKRAAALLIEPRGLVIRLLGHGPRTQNATATCCIEEVRLRPIFRELLMTVEHSMEVAV